MKINGPALGHDTVSLDPQTDPNATARQELHKLNLALEMEANLLKLHELRGTLSTEQAARWEAICQDFQRDQSMGGEGADAGQRIASQLAELVEAMKSQQSAVSITNTPSPEFKATLDTLHKTIEHTLFPLVRSMDSRIAQDIEAHSELKRLISEVEVIKGSLR